MLRCVIINNNKNERIHLGHQNDEYICVYHTFHLRLFNLRFVHVYTLQTVNEPVTLFIHIKLFSRITQEREEDFIINLFQSFFISQREYRLNVVNYTRIIAK